MKAEIRYPHDNHFDGVAEVLETKIKKAFHVWFFLAALLALVFVFGYFGILKPKTEVYSIWFQRSGSLIVMLAILMEYKLFSIHQAIFPEKITLRQFSGLENKYGKKHKIFSIISTLFAIFGTFIWGYGDLLR